MRIYFQNTFGYSSSYWTNKDTYNDNGSNGGLDNREYKGSTYWTTSFNEICVAMKYHGKLRAFSFSCPASSLYDLIADGKYRQTQTDRSQWKQLIHGSSLQRNCNKEGFNVKSSIYARVRFGILGNQENNCFSPDSFIGLGADDKHRYCFSGPAHNAAGNVASCSSDNGDKNLKVMGYILVR